MVVLLARAAETRAVVTVPATALAQAIRRPERQVRLARLLRQPTTEVVTLDRVDATSVGRLLAATGSVDVADAHVVLCARRRCCSRGRSGRACRRVGAGRRDRR